MVLAHPVEITLDTLLTAFRHAGCGDPHPIFAGGRVAMHVTGSRTNRYINILPGEPSPLTQKVAALRASLDR